MMKKWLHSEKIRPLAVVVAVALAIAVIALTSGAPHIDLTKNRAATLTAAALESTRAVDEPVALYHIESETQRSVWLDELLSRFAAANGKLTLETVDPASSRMESLISLAGVQTLDEGSILVASAKRSVVLTAADLFSYDYDKAAYSYYGVMQYTRAEFTAQDAVSRALAYVTRDDMPALFVLTGHGENGWDGTLNTLCFRNGIALETLTLEDGQSVPKNAAAVLLCNPASPVNESAVDALLAYLQDGGDMLLLTSYATDFTGLDRLVEYYGMARKTGLVIDNDASHVYSADYKYYLRPDLRENAVTAPLIEAKLRVIMPVSEAIVRSDVRRAGLNAQPLLTTTDKAYIKTHTEAVATLDQEEGDEPGRFTLGMAAVEGDTHLTWLSCATIIATGVSVASDGGNDALIESALKQMFDFPTPAEPIPGVDLMTEPAAIPIVPALIALALLPLVCLVIGLARRRKYA